MQQRGMSKKTSLVAQRAWALLHALLCARKGELCRNIFHKVIRKLIHSSTKSRGAGALLYGDHEFSFGNTPVVHVRMHRPKTSLPFRMPCIEPRVDDRDVVDGDDDVVWGDRVHRDWFLEEEGEMSDESDEGIDRKAEEFIDRFYEEMKQQRQILYL